MLRISCAQRLSAWLCAGMLIFAQSIQADEIGSDDMPWIMADESLDENVEIFPQTEDEIKDDNKGVSTRGLVEDQGQVLIEGQEIFLDIMRNMGDNLPIRSTGCDRDDLLAANTMIILGSTALVPGMTAIGVGAGSLTGAAIGSVITLEIGAIPGGIFGGAAGAVAGGGAGFTAGAASVGLVGLFVANNVKEVQETTEPCNQGAVQARSADSGEAVGLPADLDEAQYWVDFAEEVENDGVQERSARRVSSVRRVTGYAGEYESLYVHIIKHLYNDHIYDLSRNWDRSRYVPAQARAFLRNPVVRQKLKPAVDHIAFVKRYGRLQDGLPAKPLQGAQKFVYEWLSGNTTAMRDGWLRAMGMGETRLRVTNGRLTWTTPSALRLVGLPPTVSQNLPSANLNALNLVSANMNPGPFDLVLGRPSLSGSRVKVNYTISRNSRAAAFSLRHRTPTGGWTTFFSNNARLSQPLSGNVYYKFTSAGPMIDSVSFGNASISVPSIPTPPVPGINNAINNIKSQVTNKARQFATSALPIKTVLDRAADAGKKNLLKTLRSQAAAFGFNNIDRIASVSISGGTLKVRVGGYKSEFTLPALPAAAQLNSRMAQYQNMFKDNKAQQKRVTNRLQRAPKRK